jgi:hypothetical protein
VILSRPAKTAVGLVMRCGGGSMITASLGCGAVFTGCGVLRGDRHHCRVEAMLKPSLRSTPSRERKPIAPVSAGGKAARRGLKRPSRPTAQPLPSWNIKRDAKDIETANQIIEAYKTS